MATLEHEEVKYHVGGYDNVAGGIVGLTISDPNRDSHDRPAYAWTPAFARSLAAALVEAADEAEGKQPGVIEGRWSAALDHAETKFTPDAAGSGGYAGGWVDACRLIRSIAIPSSQAAGTGGAE